MADFAAGFVLGLAGGSMLTYLTIFWLASSVHRDD